MSELKAIFEEMEKRYVPGKIDEPVVFYFSLGEAEEDKWTLVLEPESCTIKQGKQDADCFLKTSKEMFVKIITGTYKPGPMDFMTGKIRSDDPFKLQVLMDVFPR